MVTYRTAAIFARSAKTLKEKIKRYDAIIAALEDSILEAAEAGSVDGYTLDNGQTKIQTTYRNPAEVARSITAFEVIRTRCVNQLNGRVIRLVDGRNFRNRC